MRKIIVFLCACLVTALVLGTSDAPAAGFGIYGSIGGDTSSTWSDDSALSHKVKTVHQGVGFVFDTAVAQDSFFNYHLNLGYDEFKVKTLSSGNNPTIGGLMISNAFGFGIVRTDNFRLWLGPEIRLAWPRGSDSGVSYDFYGAGVGPVLGMNFNNPGAVSFVVKAGYQFMHYEETGFFDQTEIKERLIYVNMGVLFRSTGDIF